MPRFEMGKCLVLSLLFAASCRPHHRRPPSDSGKPTWSFGVPRGTSSDATGDGRAPIQLTASDGTGLKLVSLDAKIAIEGPLAFTELTLGFENPLDRTLEGHFDVVLPAGAAVSRFAMRLPAGWQEAEVVEKQAARAAYEDALHRRQDPALLEKAAGNEFSARVFPIAPRAVKQIKLSYSEELPSVDEPYRLPLRGLPLMPALKILVYAGETALEVVKEQFTPDGDFLVERPGIPSGLASGKLVVARLRPSFPASPSAMAGAVILFDTSASRAPGFAKQVSELGVLVEELRRVHGDALPLRVASFDQEVAPLYAGTSAGFAHDAKALLHGVVARGALGASDLAGALAWAAGDKAGEGSHQRLILITDGVATASAASVTAKIEEAGDDAMALSRAADGLKARFDRLDVILVGGIRDDAAMRALVTHHLAEDGAVLDGAEGAARLVHRLDEATRSGVRVSVKGAAWVWPTHVDGMQRGDSLVVYAEMSDDRDRDAVTVSLAGPVDVATDVPLSSPDSPGLRPLVERAWARARITSLGVEVGAVPSTERERAAALQKQIVELSIRHRVLSDYTSLLVLETDADYARFHIDRHALSDILVVDDQGLHLEQRKNAVLAEDKEKLRDLERQVNDLKKKIKNSDSFDEKEEEETGVSKGQAFVASPEGAPSREPAVARPSPEPESVMAAPRPMAAPRMMHTTPHALPPPPPSGRESSSDMQGAHPHSARARAPEGLDGLDELLDGRAAGNSRPDRERDLDPRRLELRSLHAMPSGGAGNSGFLNERGLGTRATVNVGAAETISGALDRGTVLGVVRVRSQQWRSLYERALSRNPSLGGRLVLRFAVAKGGAIKAVTVVQSTLGDDALARSLVESARSFHFPTSEAFEFTCPFVFRSDASDGGMTPPADSGAPAYTGKMLEVMDRVEKKQLADALARALAWRAAEPGDVLALVALGNVWRAEGKLVEAARAYGSIIDLFPARADLRRFAGDELESLGAAGDALAADSFAHAVRDRADHPNSHRLRAFALLRAGHPAEAFAAIEAGAARSYPDGRFLGVDRILREDAGLLAAAWLKRDPNVRPSVEKRLAQLGTALPTGPSLRFVLSWETDANDVDFHISDGEGNRAWYAQKQLASGGSLYADVTTGYGPECFTIDGKPTAYPYRIQAHYYSRGPMGYGMGKVEIIQFDGNGGLLFDERPFVVMNDQAFVDLGAIEGPLSSK